MKYSSKDFGKVPATLKVSVPSNLIHKKLNSEPCGLSQSFSEQRNHFVSIADLPSKVMSMTLGGLKPGQSTRKHRHNYETLIYIISGQGKSLIENTFVQWECGDAIYIPVWAWHQHINTSDKQDCQYIACENAPLLLNIGEIALREESEA